MAGSCLPASCSTRAQRVGPDGQPSSLVIWHILMGRSTELGIRCPTHMHEGLDSPKRPQVRVCSGCPAMPATPRQPLALSGQALCTPEGQPSYGVSS